MVGEFEKVRKGKKRSFSSGTRGGSLQGIAGKKRRQGKRNPPYFEKKSEREKARFPSQGGGWGEKMRGGVILEKKPERNMSLNREERGGKIERDKVGVTGKVGIWEKRAL